MIKAVSDKLVLSKEARLSLLRHKVSIVTLATSSEECVNKTVSCLLSVPTAPSEHLVRHDSKGAGRALIRLKLPWEKEKAIVAHQMTAWVQHYKLLFLF